MNNTEYLKSRLDLLKIYISATFGAILVTLAYMAQNLSSDDPLKTVLFKSLSFMILLAPLVFISIRLEKDYIYFANQLNGHAPEEITKKARWQFWKH